MVQLKAKGHLNMRAGNQLAAHNLGHAPGVLGLTLWGDGTQYCLRVAVSNYTNQYHRHNTAKRNRSKNSITVDHA